MEVAHTPEQAAVLSKLIEAQARFDSELSLDPSVADKVEVAGREKALGNELHGVGLYAEAKKQYDRAFICLYIDTDAWELNLGEEERALVTAAKQVLHLNRAACKLKLGQCAGALWDAEKALELEPANEKARYRVLLCHAQLAEHELGLHEAGELASLERAEEWLGSAEASLGELSAAGKQFAPLSARCRQSRRRLKAAQRRAAADQKKLYGNMHTGMERGHAREAAQAEGEFEDMPGLETDEE